MGLKETSMIEQHMNNFLDECLTEEKTFTRKKSHKKHRNKTRPSTSQFNKKPHKIAHQRINVKTRNTRNHPDGVNSSFEAMISKLHKLKKKGNKKEYNKLGSESFEISKMVNSTLAPHSKSTNRINKRSNSGKVKRRANDKKMDINNYKMLKMLSKEDITQNQSMFTKPNPKVIPWHHSRFGSSVIPTPRLLLTPEIP